MEIIELDTEYIKLDQFLKWAGIADNGGFAKMMIQNGDVKVNNEVVCQRGKKVKNGDIVKVSGAGQFKVVAPVAAVAATTATSGEENKNVCK
jgi:ribosome-associated protein